MFAKGKIRGNGAQLARYLMTGEESERVELVDTRGLEAFGRDPAAAFAALQNVADANTQSTKPFFHGHIRLPADERLTDRQWMQTLDLMEKRLGFEGQPRIVTFHIDRESGDKHLHVGWFRIDLETMRAIDPGLYKNDLRQLCREQERAYGLRQLDNERKPHDIAPSQNETEESRRLGTDVREIRAAILDCVERSDSGKAFKAALEERGFILANGDRRDCFVVIDQAGGQHALNKKLTGMTLAAIRERFADLDRSQLPGVEQAQAMQRDRQAELEAQREPAVIPLKEPANENKSPHEPMQDLAAAAIAEPHTVSREPSAAHELAASADAAIDQATHAGAGMLNGLGKLFTDVIGWLGDFIAPSVPPTRAEAETMALAAEEKREQQQVHAEGQAQHWLIIEAQRRAREREEAETEQEQAHRRAQDRGYERER